MQTRRGFLKLFAGLMVSGVTGSVFGKGTTIPRAKLLLKDTHAYEEILWKAYFPLLKQNENECLSFYKCSENKITVGYGTNVESNKDLLKRVPLFCKNKKLSDSEKEKFLATLKEKTEAELKKYSITQFSAEKLAKEFTLNAIQNIVSIFKEKKVNFFDFPLPMQILALDIYYNVGRKGFLKYKRFKKALIKKDYSKAVKEGKVKAGEKINTERERRKKRLLSLTKIRIDNPFLSLEETKKLAEKSYQQETPKLTRILVGKKDKISEEAILTGDFNLERTRKIELAQVSHQNTTRT